jgi:hypothetical protein
MATVVKERLHNAAHQLGARDPVGAVGSLIDRSFDLPFGDPRYGHNALTPGAAPFEPSFSEREPEQIRFTISPLGPQATPIARRDEATREMRRLVGGTFGREPLRWLDSRSEEWRGFSGIGSLSYGGWFGSAFDPSGLAGAKVYYELTPGAVSSLPPSLQRMARHAKATMPELLPAFMTLSCRRDSGAQRVTFLHPGTVRLRDLQPLMDGIGLGDRLGGIMQVVGLVLGGRFELPPRSLMIGVGESSDGPELKLEIILGQVPDLPDKFLDLLALGLAERPRQLRALGRWIHAFTPNERDEAGDFSVMSVRTTPTTAPRVSLYLRPVDFDVRHLEGAPR